MYYFRSLICTFIAYGVEFLVNASFCLMIYNWFIMDLFSLPVISFWEMYGLVWFLQGLNGKVFDTFFNEILKENKINELPDNEDSSTIFEIDLSDDPDMEELFDKIKNKIKKNPKDEEEKEEDDEDGED